MSRVCEAVGIRSGPGPGQVWRAAGLTESESAIKKLADADKDSK